MNNDLTPHASAQLAGFAASLRFEDIPEPVLRRTEDLLIDWFGSALAGKNARAVEVLAAFCESMGPATGPSEILIHRRTSSPVLAAMANAAASHVAEQDDVHNGSVFHPATVVFPPALAVAQSLGPASPATRWASVWASLWGVRTTRCFTPPARRARWRRPSRWGGCWG